MGLLKPALIISRDCCEDRITDYISKFGTVKMPKFVSLALFVEQRIPDLINHVKLLKRCFGVGKRGGIWDEDAVAEYQERGQNPPGSYLPGLGSHHRVSSRTLVPWYCGHMGGSLYSGENLPLPLIFMNTDCELTTYPALKLFHSINSFNWTLLMNKVRYRHVNGGVKISVLYPKPELLTSVIYCSSTYLLSTFSWKALRGA